MASTSTLAFHVAGLQAQLAASVGLPEATAAALSQQALPLLVHSLGTAEGLGSPENLRAMCQQLYQTQAHTDLAELTRPDGGWPEHRRHLAQTLLGAGRFHALAGSHAPATPGQASDWMGCLALVALATAGQQAAEHHLDANGLQNWLRAQAAPGPVAAPVVAAAPAAVAGPAAARSETGTAPWWPLAVLAVVGIGASSYFWQKQTMEAARPLIAAVQKAVASVAAPAAEAPAPEKPAPAAKPAAEVRTAKPAALRGSDNKLAAVLALRRKEGALVAIPHRSAVLPVASGGQPAPSLSVTMPRGEGARDVQPAAPAQSNANSAEAVLSQRLANPEGASRKPIDLDRLSFAPGQATMGPEGAQQLGNIASLLKTHPRYRLIVFGNAETSEPHSIALALDRANLVIAELVKQGVPSTALQAQGHLRPAADKADDPAATRRPALYISSME
ncbi:OmpA family protein [Hymenobacter caeli]|uniref:Outer membrane protein OmpA-like peptidoglycan-associated protein n=1 Tax=Hymenobacter caeli TaxID=2735894 RepID=A0ABX2FQW9_9BACT|nr:OmpA family protein [Hymenobacter caeli]NRT19248.1 outer membrane protein OmpA-like peptidoglycan-associated protein [Hymenobacter caeli]